MAHSEPRRRVPVIFRLHSNHLATQTTAIPTSNNIISNPILILITTYSNPFQSRSKSTIPQAFTLPPTTTNSPSHSSVRDRTHPCSVLVIQHPGQFLAPLLRPQLHLSPSCLHILGPLSQTPPLPLQAHHISRTRLSMARIDCTLIPCPRPLMATHKVTLKPYP